MTKRKRSAGAFSWPTVAASSAQTVCPTEYVRPRSRPRGFVGRYRGAPWRETRKDQNRDPDTDSDRWSRKDQNRELSWLICMAIRFDKCGERPTVGSIASHLKVKQRAGRIASQLNVDVESVIQAIKRSTRLSTGDTYFCPEVAERLEDWRVTTIPRRKDARRKEDSTQERHFLHR